MFCSFNPKPEEMQRAQAMPNVPLVAMCLEISCMYSVLQMFLWVISVVRVGISYYSLLTLFAWVVSLFIIHWCLGFRVARANQCPIELLSLLLLLDSLYSLLLMGRLSLLLPYLTVAGTVTKIQIVICFVRCVYKSNLFVQENSNLELSSIQLPDDADNVAVTIPLA